MMHLADVIAGGPATLPDGAPAEGVTVDLLPGTYGLVGSAAAVPPWLAVLSGAVPVISGNVTLAGAPLGSARRDGQVARIDGRLPLPHSWTARDVFRLHRRDGTVSEVLDAFDLARLAGASVATLSLAERLAVFWAEALSRPEVRLVVADEIPEVRGGFYAECMLRLQRARDRRVVVIALPPLAALDPQLDGWLLASPGRLRSVGRGAPMLNRDAAYRAWVTHGPELASMLERESRDEQATVLAVGPYDVVFSVLRAVDAARFVGRAARAAGVSVLAVAELAPLWADGSPPDAGEEQGLRKPPWIPPGRANGDGGHA